MPRMVITRDMGRAAARTIEMPNNKHGPLTGVTVIDLGQIYNGPYCTFLMAMAGARVIKVEPRGGENLRRRAKVGGAAVPFAMLNPTRSSFRST